MMIGYRVCCSGRQIWGFLVGNLLGIRQSSDSKFKQEFWSFGHRSAKKFNGPDNSRIWSCVIVTKKEFKVFESFWKDVQYYDIERFERPGNSRNRTCK